MISSKPIAGSFW